MKKCPYCGTEITDKAVYICPRCKATVNEPKEPKEKPVPKKKEG